MHVITHNLRYPGCEPNKKHVLCFPTSNLSHVHTCTMIATGNPRRRSTCQWPVEPSSQSALSLERRALH